MRSALGIGLLVFAGFSVLATVSLNMKAEADNLPAAQRLGQTVGSSLCTLTLVGAGIVVLRGADTRPPALRRRGRGRPRR